MKKTIILFFLIIIISNCYAQQFKKEGLKSYEGYFDFFYDETSDKIYLQVDKLEEQFLYVSSLASGVGSNDIGLDRGQMGHERVVYFKKAGNKLLRIF